MDNDKALFSCAEDDESLSCDNEDDAILEWLEQADIECVGETITVYEFKRMEVSEKDRESHATDMAERLLENLDENYGNPNGYTKVTDAHKNLAREFVDKMLSCYHVWACECVGQKDHDVIKWLDEHPGELNEGAEKEIREKLAARESEGAK